MTDTNGEVKMSDRTLDLSKLVESPQVKMPDGNWYELLSPDQVGVRVTGMFTSWVRRRLGLRKAQSLDTIKRDDLQNSFSIVDEESANRLAQFSRSLCEQIAPSIPKEQLDAIGEFGHLKLIGFWGDMYWEKIAEMGDAEGKAMPTSVSSSLGSNVSTEATPSDG